VMPRRRWPCRPGVRLTGHRWPGRPLAWTRSPRQAPRSPMRQAGWGFDEHSTGARTAPFDAPVDHDAPQRRRPMAASQAHAAPDTPCRSWSPAGLGLILRS
jgi:hypothetical protein